MTSGVGGGSAVCAVRGLGCFRPVSCECSRVLPPVAEPAPRSNRLLGQDVAGLDATLESSLGARPAISLWTPADASGLNGSMSRPTAFGSTARDSSLGAAGEGFEPSNEHSPVAGFQDRARFRQPCRLATECQFECQSRQVEAAGVPRGEQTDGVRRPRRGGGRLRHEAARLSRVPARMANAFPSHVRRPATFGFRG